MKWDLISTNWEEFKGKARQHWAMLTVAQLDAAAGHRDRVAASIQQAYGISKHAAEWQLSGWQHRLLRSAKTPG